MNKKKIKKGIVEAARATKTAVGMTAPVLVGAGIYHAGYPVVGETVFLMQIPWMFGIVGHAYTKILLSNRDMAKAIPAGVKSNIKKGYYERRYGIDKLPGSQYNQLRKKGYSNLNAKFVVYSDAGII